VGELIEELVYRKEGVKPINYTMVCQPKHFAQAGFAMISFIFFGALIACEIALYTHVKATL
jgi:hypothetical protein